MLFPPTTCIGNKRFRLRGEGLTFPFYEDQLSQFTWAIPGFSIGSPASLDPPQPSVPPPLTDVTNNQGDTQAGQRHCLSHLKESGLYVSQLVL